MVLGFASYRSRTASLGLDGFCRNLKGGLFLVTAVGRGNVARMVQGLPEGPEQSERVEEGPGMVTPEPSQLPGCVFPMIGRMDPRSNWVPMHYMKGLLSLVGGRIFQCLGIDEVEVWRLRAVAGTFRYGVAHAYERARGAIH